jgi:DNA-binding transcriptional ArsR family regulator
MARDESTERLQLLARLIQHPLRQRLLFKYAEAVTSPSAVAADLGEPLNLVSYHTKVLLEAGCIELVRTRRRRGATEHFYRALVVSELDDLAWERLPTGLRRALVRLTLDATRREAADALGRGGMDTASAHVSRSYFMLDAQGRAELGVLLQATLAKAGEIERTSRERGGAEVPWQLVLLSFERASRP